MGIGRPRVRTDEERRQIRNAYMRRWKAAHPDRVMAIKRRYRKAHPEKENGWNRARKTRMYSFVESLKNRPCADCGGSFPSVCMDFDHVRGEKKFTIAANLGASEATILEEVAKCEVVCSNCHRVRTKRRHDERRLVVSLGPI